MQKLDVKHLVFERLLYMNRVGVLADFYLLLKCNIVFIYLKLVYLFVVISYYGQIFIPIMSSI